MLAVSTVTAITADQHDSKVAIGHVGKLYVSTLAKPSRGQVNDNPLWVAFFGVIP